VTAEERLAREAATRSVVARLRRKLARLGRLHGWRVLGFDTGRHRVAVRGVSVVVPAEDGGREVIRFLTPAQVDAAHDELVATPGTGPP
jgi:hypothetical protein